MSLQSAKITRIEAIPLRTPLSKTVAGSTLKLTHRSAIFTRVYTDQGIVGECYNGNDDELQGAIIKNDHTG